MDRISLEQTVAPDTKTTPSAASAEKKTSFLDNFVNDVNDLREGLQEKLVTVFDHDVHRQTLLHRAIITMVGGQPRREVVNLLLKNNADPNALDEDGLSPFMYDAFNEKCHFQCFWDWINNDERRVLDSKGVNKLTGMTVMMHVAGPPRTPYDSYMVRALLKDENAAQRILSERDVQGRTALFYAVVSTHQHKATREVVSALLDVGFPLTDTDIYGQNIAHIIASNPDINADILVFVSESKYQTQATKMLEQADIDNNTPAHLAGEAQNISAFSKIKKILPQTECNQRQETALMCLCKNLTNPSSLRNALEGLSLSEEYLNEVDVNGNTALCFALLSMSATNCTDSAIRQVTMLFMDRGLKTDKPHDKSGMTAHELSLSFGNSGFLRHVMGRGVQVLAP